MATAIPPNQAAFTLTEIMAATGGSVRGPLADAAMQVHGIGTDTRTLTAGQAFVALSGERFDGHAHLSAAAAKGAVLALVDREVTAPAGLTTLRVPSTLDALGALAAAHIDRWRALTNVRQVVALTGSAGKTTTKAAIHEVLAEVTAADEIHTAPGNLNNLVGVPMVVLGLHEGHRFAVLELGTNRPGEIGKLARMLRPDVGLITLIARAHSAGLGSLEAIAKEKTALFDELGAVAIGNADDALVSSALAHCDAMQRLRYGESRDAQYRIVGRELVSPETSRVTLARADGGEVSVEIPLLGRAGALACAAAVATVEVLTGASLSAAAIRNGLARVQGAGRLHPRRAPSGLWVIDDSYNANPASCRSSIETAKEIAEVTGGRLVLVLGEMRELGDASVAAHRELGDLVAASGAAWVIAVGGDARYLATRAAELGVDSHFCDVSAAAAELASELVHESDVVLVKGSRGVETERVVDTLMGEGRGGAGRMGPANHHAGVAS